MAPFTSPIRRGRPREWSPERIEVELRELTRDAEWMPTVRDLDYAGREDLRAAIVAYGGVRFWAERLELRLRPHQLGPRAISTEALLAEARTVMDQLGFLPGANKLRQLGRRDLALAVLDAGGSRAYCHEHDLPYRDGRCSAVRRR